MPNQLQSFLFPNHAIRGCLVRLDTSLTEALAIRAYPSAIEVVLTDAILALLLLSHTLKQPNTISMQINGTENSSLKLLLAQCDYRHQFRCLATWRSDELTTDLQQLTGNATIVFTTYNDISQQMFQSVVAITENNLQHCLEHYFKQSEQIPTRFYLFKRGKQAAGLLLQALPDEREEMEDWQRINYLAATLTEQEIFTLDNDMILHRLFHEETVEMYGAKNISYQCKCSVKKMQQAVKLLGRDDADALLEEQGIIEVTCDFCNQQYRFDKTDIALIFANSVITDTPKNLQ